MLCVLLSKLLCFLEIGLFFFSVLINVSLIHLGMFPLTPFSLFLWILLLLSFHCFFGKISRGGGATWRSGHHVWKSPRGLSVNVIVPFRQKLPCGCIGTLELGKLNS